MKIFVKKRPIDYIIYSVIIALGIAVDQLSKWLISSNMELTEPAQTIPLIKNILHITYTTNKGMAFGLFDGPNERWIFLTVSTIAIIAFSIYLYLGHADNMLYGVAFSMVVSGGIGNMIDRFGFGFYVNQEGIGEVIDFIDFRAFPEIWNAIFNIADSLVCVGAGLLILALIIDLVKEAKAKKALPEGETDDNAETTSPDEEDKAE